ncbi:PP2C family protein-serine/threonine phosphatase [Halioxenophilus sp. WMMB6]|uniref:PP2C family protein-serine/threonine phosphatase n=1 Tax=Halioxenophilus sp. WMMB6 TaxID=3073815 RepID=UPI00295ECA23|nr:protein phosphatase 2C domain-containing protein [Halioxenophilus sp. WMMB6]
MPVSFAAKTDPGKVRTNNEDSYTVDVNLGLFMVADGMGGHDAGEVAAAMAIFQTHRYIAAGVSLTDSLSKTHQDILQAGGKNRHSMGSTGVALHHLGDQYEVGWVGDSRAYRYTFGTGQNLLERLTQDHSFVQTLIDQGSITEEEARVHPQRNVITQCLGNRSQEQVKVGKTAGIWRPNQWLLLCSDGLTGELDDQAISQILSSCNGSENAVELLVQAAIAKGGNDNITVIIVESPKQPSWIDSFRQKLLSLLPKLTPA